MSVKQPSYLKKHKKQEKQSTPVQRVIIPKGIVNPNQTTVIEIPRRYENMSTVIARAPNVRLEDSTSSMLLPTRGDDRYYHTRSPFNRTAYYKSLSPKENYDFLEEEEEEIQQETSSDMLGAAKSLPSVSNYLNEKTLNENERYDIPRKYQKFYYANKSQIPEELYYEDADASMTQQDIEDQYYSNAESTQYYNPYNKAYRSTRSHPRRQTYQEYEDNGTVQYIPRNKTHPKSAGVKRVLDNMDAAEFSGLEKDLKNFQTARRKLLYGVSTMKMV